MDAVARICESGGAPGTPVRYPAPIEEAAALLQPHLPARLTDSVNGRWAALRLLDGDASIVASMEALLGLNLAQDDGLQDAVARARAHIQAGGISPNDIGEAIVSGIVQRAEAIGAWPCGSKTRSTHAGTGG